MHRCNIFGEGNADLHPTVGRAARGDLIDRADQGEGVRQRLERLTPAVACLRLLYCLARNGIDFDGHLARALQRQCQPIRVGHLGCARPNTGVAALLQAGHQRDGGQ
ncbi:MAG: hypothetical protein C4311_15255 [Chloroflexota bacterium]